MAKRKRNPDLNEGVHTDTPEAYELFLYATSDGNLYRQRVEPIVLNLAKKIRNGTYDKVKAVKLWRYAADDAAQRYTKEFGTSGRTSFGIFTVPVRNEVATLLQIQYDEYLHEVAAKLPPLKSRKKNPVDVHGNILSLDKVRFGLDANGNHSVWVSTGGKRARKIQTNGNLPIIHRERPARFEQMSQNAYKELMDYLSHRHNPAPRIGTARPFRNSQITKKKPSKRLVKRRLKNTNKGRFPNPSPMAFNILWPYGIKQVHATGVITIARVRSKGAAEQIAACLQDHAKGNTKFMVEHSID